VCPVYVAKDMQLWLQLGNGFPQLRTPCMV
jgi:hypothetical protein